MRLIDADALEREIMVMTDDELCEDCCYNVVNKLSAAPTVDAVPVKHGRWVNIANIANGYCPDLSRCSECNGIYFGIGGYNYCPNCGADMRDGERKDT